MQQAGFPHLKTFDGYVDTHITFPGESTLVLLREMAWLKRKENLLLMGAVGTGKTHMATALGIEACRQGMQCNFTVPSIWSWCCKRSLQPVRLAAFRKN
ncbi:ATP-binding protein [Paenibacillus popilliae]|uniref:ATP-binding protein n=1 Tax=Paenibacillus popilliae TaxID=78057 RepID=UPI000301164C|nr:ATP-binding protein [Paenibacillus popilliae]